MHRALSAIIAAILLTQPKMSTSLVTQYAKVVQQEADEHYFDPYTMVAMVHFESRWRANVTSGIYIGLGQISLMNSRYCRENPEGERCQARKVHLLNGSNNLRAVAASITINRRFCRKKTGHAKFRHWLASHGGFNSPNKGIWCGQKKVRGRWEDVDVPHIVQRVIDRRRRLARH